MPNVRKYCVRGTIHAVLSQSGRFCLRSGQRSEVSKVPRAASAHQDPASSPDSLHHNRNHLLHIAPPTDADTTRPPKACAPLSSLSSARRASARPASATRSAPVPPSATPSPLCAPARFVVRCLTPRSRFSLIVVCLGKVHNGLSRDDRRGFHHEKRAAPWQPRGAGHAADLGESCSCDFGEGDRRVWGMG